MGSSQVNPLERLIRRVDATQQRFGPAALIFGVMKKFGDDNAGTLVSSLAFSGFICVFPLLLVLITVLNLVLAGDPGAEKALLHSALGQFPVIGSQLGQNVHGLHRSSVIGLVVGVLGLLWGSTGLAQAGLFSMAQVWNLPGPDRPNYITRLGRSFAYLGVLGSGLIVTTTLASFGTFGRHNIGLGLVSEVAAVGVNVVVYVAAFRVLTPKAVHTRALLPGAALGGVVWTILQAVGATSSVMIFETTVSSMGSSVSSLGSLHSSTWQQRSPSTRPSSTRSSPNICGPATWSNHLSPRPIRSPWPSRPRRTSAGPNKRSRLVSTNRP